MFNRRRQETKTAAPPSYSTVGPTVLEADAMERHYDWTSPVAWYCRCKDKRPCGYACPNRLSMGFGFQPVIFHKMTTKRLFRDRESELEWRAVLSIQARNLPRLMCRGFFWSAQNIVRGEDRIVLHTKPSSKWIKQSYSSQWGWESPGGSWKHRRVYQVRDKWTDSDWVGVLIIYGKKPSTVINFDVDWITKDTTVWAFAYDRNGKLVYDTRGGPGESFNTMFPGKALEGWWPWPKAPTIETTDSGSGDIETDGNDAQHQGKSAAQGGLRNCIRRSMSQVAQRCSVADWSLLRRKGTKDERK